MEHGEMVRKLAKSGEHILRQMTPEGAHLLHMAVGISGETGELLEAFETARSASQEADKKNVIEELGDIEFYLEGMRQGLILDRTTVMMCPIDNIVWANTRPITLCVGLSIHAANLLDQVKKQAVYAKELDEDAVIQVMARIELYMGTLRDQLGITRIDVLKDNMSKLGVRYGADYEYTNTKAQERADKK